MMADAGNDWAVTINNKKQNLICEQKSSKNGGQIIRVQTDFDHCALTMFRAIVNPEMRKKYDKNIQDIRAVK